MSSFSGLQVMTILPSPPNLLISMNSERLLTFELRFSLFQERLQPFHVICGLEAGALAELFKLYLRSEIRVQPLVQRLPGKLKGNGRCLCYLFCHFLCLYH